MNRFWRNTRTEKHRPDDPLNTDPPAPRPDPNPPITRRGSTCEFCECSLAPSGEVLRMGDKAKHYRDFDAKLEKKDKEIAALQAEVSELKSKLAAATNSDAPRTRKVGALIE